MPSDIKEPEHEPPEQGSDDDSQSPSPNTHMEMTSHNTTTSSVDEEFSLTLMGVGTYCTQK